MKIVVIADEKAFEIIKNSNNDAEWLRLSSVDLLDQHHDADACFDLRTERVTDEFFLAGKPCFINSVVQPLGAEKNIIRFNGWNGFLENDTWEVTGEVGENARKILSFLDKTIIETADEPGFISPRIIAMIINEAYYAKEEAVSTEGEIDTAMKLGTNYPQGPFEWAEKIGHKNIVALLQKLSETDTRYQPAASLVRIAQQS